MNKFYQPTAKQHDTEQLAAI